MNPQEAASGFNNLGVTIIIDDGPGDTTVRPSRPEFRAFLEAERDKIRKWGAEEQKRIEKETKTRALEEKRRNGDEH